MRFRLYREYGSLNSPPVFDAVEAGLRKLGHQITTDEDDIPVIWSVLWHGRMAQNKFVYERAKKNKRPVLIIEVGNLIRNKTWRISLNHINGLGNFSNLQNLDYDRPKKMGIFLKEPNAHRRSEILIATQLPQSLQWAQMPSMSDWVKRISSNLKMYTDRQIIVRPHPRGRFFIDDKNIKIQSPKKIVNTYDDYDIDYSYHCVINHNSGPAVQAAIAGTPVICDNSSLAAELSGKISEIENISLPDRTDWFVRLSHTEWTVEEIFEGIPFKRLQESLDLSST